MQKQISPGVVVVVIIVVLVIIAGIWYVTHGKPKQTGWEGPVPKAQPPGGGPVGGGGPGAPVPAAPPAPPAAPAPGGK